jgi:vacuolar-type H+-ATPase subunit C/Vma6
MTDSTQSNEKLRLTRDKIWVKNLLTFLKKKLDQNKIVLIFFNGLAELTLLDSDLNLTLCWLWVNLYLPT